MAEPSCDGSGSASGRSCLRGSGLGWPVAFRVWRFARDVRGSTAMEYALIGGLIFVVVAGSIRYYGSRMIPIYNQISTAVTQAH